MQSLSTKILGAIVALAISFCAGWELSTRHTDAQAMAILARAPTAHEIDSAKLNRQTTEIAAADSSYSQDTAHAFDQVRRLRVALATPEPPGSPETHATLPPTPDTSGLPIVTPASTGACSFGRLSPLLLDSTLTSLVGAVRSGERRVVPRDFARATLSTEIAVTAGERDATAVNGRHGASSWSGGAVWPVSGASFLPEAVWILHRLGPLDVGPAMLSPPGAPARPGVAVTIHW